MCCNFEILSSPPIKQNHKAAVACLASGCRVMLPQSEGAASGKKREDRASSSCCFMTHNYCWRYNCQSTGQKSNCRACADQSVGSLFLLCNIYLGHFWFLFARAAFSLSLSISFFQSFILCFFRASMKSKQIRPNVKATRLRVHIPAMSFPSYLRHAGAAAAMV